MDNSFIQNPNHPYDDPNVTIERYERTFEQNEDLGFNDMVTEGYYQKSGDQAKKNLGEKGLDHYKTKLQAKSDLQLLSKGND